MDFQKWFEVNDWYTKNFWVDFFGIHDVLPRMKIAFRETIPVIGFECIGRKEEVFKLASTFYGILDFIETLKNVWPSSLILDNGTDNSQSEQVQFDHRQKRGINCPWKLNF